MIVDCDRCAVRGLRCGDCVVTALLGAPPEGWQLDGDEHHAIGVLAQAGLVPPLRLVLSSKGSGDRDPGERDPGERDPGERAPGERQEPQPRRERRKRAVG